MIILQIQIGDCLVIDLCECQPMVTRDRHCVSSGPVALQRMKAEIRRHAQFIERTRRDDERQHITNTIGLDHAFGVAGFGKPAKRLVANRADFNGCV